ncbi:alanine--tRNA ligase [soil metagenome]
MDANELRRAFTGFFEERDHALVGSASLIPHHPSAPMFTNSGMMPFVPYFLGEEPAPWARATSVQKCVRAGGKHNDLDAIGRSPRHLSFFEMLGNFSFGDYFQAEAIGWAWELLTDVRGIDPDRLWVTVHTDDDEAERIWTDVVGFPPERIQRLGKDNFWEMGETGPCGPCSEIFWDYGPEMGPDGGPANPEAEHRYVEIWNLVFPQYLRDDAGALSDLPRKGVETGAGLDRILTVLNGTTSVFETGTLLELVGAAEAVTGRRLGESEQGDVALRLIADHARTMTFLVSDGVIPSNEDRGYVLRRIIRRAVRYAYLLGVERPVAAEMAGRTIDVMAVGYPELEGNRELVMGVLGREEDQFRRTLQAGLGTLDAQLDRIDERGTLAGSVAFQLHDTYGFPLEVTTEIAADRGYDVDLSGFETAMADQKQKARQAGKRTGVEVGGEAATYQELLDTHGLTEFTGRAENESKATVLAVIGPVDGDASGELADVSIVLDRTPFYAESGGQVGDAGLITTDTGQAQVLDTTYGAPGLHRHHARLLDGEITPGQDATATIDDVRRAAIRRKHTGTHVLHWALRKVLGAHVKQQGSWVGPDRLRFDFSHFEPITAEQLVAIEDLANSEILANDPVRHYETTKEHAEAVGAIAFFGDKYGDIVRVLEAGRHSVELCGGTHVRALGDIGPVKVTSEGSIGSNLRRLEAVTGTGPIERLRHEEATLGRAAQLLGVPTEEVVDGLEKRLAEVKALRKELDDLRRRAAGAEAAGLADTAVEGVVVARVDCTSREELRDLAVALRDQPTVRAVVLGGAPAGGGAALVAAVTKGSGLNASELIADAARTVKGGGGKSPDLAVAGGKDASQLDAALDQARAAAGVA